MTTNELKTRTKAFALRCLKVAEALPKTITGRTIARQIARSGTSVGANYRAVCRARSKAEFVAKLGVVEEEADETAFWLELSVDAGILPIRKLGALKKEAEELVAIFAASRISATRNLRRAATLRINRRSQTGNRKSP